MMHGSLKYTSLAALESHRRLQRCSSSEIALILDFDNTLTRHNNISGSTVTTWHIVERNLPAVGRREYARLHNHYVKLELSGRLTKVQASAWCSDVLDLFVRHHANMDLAADQVNKLIETREGVAELFDLCDSHSIPVVILSAGIKNVIDLWARNIGVQPTLVMATKLNVGPDNRVVSWQKESFVHIHNKAEVNNQHFENIKRDKIAFIVVGDGIADCKMAPPKSLALRIRQLDILSGKGESDILIQTGTCFEMVNTATSLIPVVDLIREVVTKSPTTKKTSILQLPS